MLMDEADTNRLARHQGATIVDVKNATRHTGIPIALDSSTWSEPKSAYNAKYPFNHVKQTESGHIIELDDTADNERIHVYHKRGTFTEVDPSGSQITRIVGDTYEIWERNGFLYVKGKANITVEGSVNILVKNDCNLQVDGDLRTEVHGDYDLNVAGEIKVTAGNDISLKTPQTIRAEGEMAMKLKSAVFLAQGTSMAAIKGSVVAVDGLFLQPNLAISPGATSAIATAASAAGGVFPNSPPVDGKSPLEPVLSPLGFTLSAEQRVAFEVEKIHAYAKANDTNLSDEARLTAREYGKLKTEELDSNAVISLPVVEEPALASQYDCPVGRMVVAAARLDLGIIETGAPNGLNYGGKLGGGMLSPGVFGRIDAMLKLCGLDNQAEVRRKGEGLFWCAAAVTAWWKSAGLKVPSGSASCRRWEEWAHEHGYFSLTPKIGAAILYGTSGAAHHIGIVSSVGADGSITTIEGNTTGGDFNRNGCGWFIKTPPS